MALCIARAIVSQNMNYIDLQKYAHLQEASPFQERILMAFVLRAAEDSRPVLRVYDALFHKTVDTPEDFAVMVVDCVCLLLMLPVTVALTPLLSATAAHHLAGAADDASGGRLHLCCAL